MTVCRHFVRDIRGSHLHREAARIGVLTLKHFTASLQDFPRHHRIIWSGSGYRSAFLATVTNGEVFVDYLGTFSQIRSALKAFYPEDVLKKKVKPGVL